MIYILSTPHLLWTFWFRSAKSKEQRARSKEKVLKRHALAHGRPDETLAPYVPPQNPDKRADQRTPAKALMEG